MTGELTLKPTDEILSAIWALPGVAIEVERLTHNLSTQAKSIASKHVDTGAYGQSIHTTLVRRPGGRPVGMVVASDPKAHFVEYGTFARTTTSGASRGSMPPIGVLRLAAAALGLPVRLNNSRQALNKSAGYRAARQSAISAKRTATRRANKAKKAAGG